MAGMAGVLEEAIPKIGNDNEDNHIVCYCNMHIALCGIDVTDHIYLGELTNSNINITCIECYIANEDPYYKCPICGE